MDFVESEWGDQIVGVFQKKGSSGCSSNSVQVADNEPDQHDATIDDQCRHGGERTIECALAAGEECECDDEEDSEGQKIVVVPGREGMAVQEGEKGALRAAGGAGETGELVE